MYELLKKDGEARRGRLHTVQDVYKRQAYDGVAQNTGTVCASK